MLQLSQRYLSQAILRPFFGISFAALTLHCGSDEASPTQVCEPEAVQSCEGEGGCDGEQVCNDSGSGYGRCSCTVVSIDAGSDAPADTNLGERCETIDDCSPGLFCMTPGSDELGGGGPPGGWCTARCSDDPQLCSSLSPIGACLVFDDNGTPDFDDDVSFCTELCLLGTPEDLAAENKCHLRPEMVCVASPGEQVGTCQPLCGSDIECGNGRVCDLRAGLCVDPPTLGDPVGSACDPSEDNCAGLCIPLTEDDPDNGMCTAFCTVGNLIGCGSEGAEPTGLCDVLDPNTGLGDVGACSQLCDCNDDCLHPDLLCAGFDDPDVEALFGSLGVCLLGGASGGADAGASSAGIACE